MKKIAFLLIIGAFVPIRAMLLPGGQLGKNIVEIQSRGNIIDSMKADVNSTQQHAKHNGCPWVPKQFTYPSGTVGLHKEIEHFWDYMQLTRAERELRRRVVASIESTVHQTWPRAKVEIFGSIVAGLDLPTSDIDLAVVNGPTRLQPLADQMSVNNISEPNSMEVKENYTVPIIRFIERESKISIDMKLLVPEIMLLKEYKQKYPKFVKLMLVLKQLFREHGLNDKVAGGVSSHELTLMTISFLQIHSQTNANRNDNLGDLLLDLLEVYGRKFDYTTHGITTRNGGAFLPRNELPCGLFEGKTPFFCIQDAIDSTHNSGLGTYHGESVKQVFHDAFVALSKAVSSDERGSANCTENSILSSIVYVDEHFIKYRNWIENTFGHTLSSRNLVN